MIRVKHNTMGIKEKADLERLQMELPNLDQLSGDALVELATMIAGNMDAIIELADIIAGLEAKMEKLAESNKGIN